MEECEHLCNKLGIMVNGELQCFGRIQHLKNKFAHGYTLTLRSKSSALTQPVFDAITHKTTTHLAPVL